MSSISSLSSYYQSLVYSSLFEKSDADSDGSVTSEELADSISSIQDTLEDSTLDADSVFAAMDADEDGSVTEEEYTDGLASIVDSTTTTTTDTEEALRLAISSYVSSIQSSMASTLLGSDSELMSSSSFSDVLSAIKEKYGITSSSVYSSDGTSSSSSLVSVLLDTSA